MFKQNDQSEKLAGSIERVTFHNETNGFCVLKVKVKNHKDLVTVVGNAANITAGEFIECEGFWLHDKKHGVQFKATQLDSAQPSTVEGMQKYLASGMVKGIGPHFAKKMIQAFGEQVFHVIEKTPERLFQCEGIGKKRQAQIVAAWAEQKVVRDIMVFLQSHGVGTSRAVRIYKTYGDKAIDTVKKNPYQLALDIRGIGFKTADELAQRLGIPQDSLVRAQAGLRHVLMDLCGFGHCAATIEKLVAATVELLGVDEQRVQQALIKEVAEGRLVKDTIEQQACVFMATLYKAEKYAAEHIKRLLSGQPSWGVIDTDTAIPWVEKETGLQLSSSQKSAISAVLRHKCSVVTGGPGVGKTTIVNSIIKILKSKQMSVTLCAPTGRAAKRMSETTGMEAKTIHRLLEFDPSSMGFKHNEDQPLVTDVLVVDEASMLDVNLFYALLKALPKRTGVIFVGDVDQLPSVGSGNVLSDLIASQVVPVMRLTEIFRQAASSKIIVNAHRINEGKMPLPNEHHEVDFYTLYVNEPEQAFDKTVELITQRIPKKYQCDAIQNIQCLSPMNRGGLGCQALNIALQAALNPNPVVKISRFGTTYAPKDKVIQTINNYDKEVFNGDIGFIESMDLDEAELSVNFEGRSVLYEFSELDELSLAYAISIHKSQGSEFPIVVMPLAMQHYALLARKLVYTGVTRGKQLVILVGQKKAVSMAVKNFREQNRLTKLKEWLVT